MTREGGGHEGWPIDPGFVALDVRSQEPAGLLLPEPLQIGQPVTSKGDSVAGETDVRMQARSQSVAAPTPLRHGNLGITVRPSLRYVAAFMTETQRPILVINPANDTGFRDRADSALREGQSVAELQQILRADYPRAIVRSRDLAGERLVVWYVYRDGRWVTRDDRE